MIKMISVIVPTFNSERSIKACLNSILNQNFKEKYEIIVVLDKRTNDKTLYIVREYKKNFKNIKLLICNRKGSGAARNFGVKYAKGKYILFTDSDCRVSRNWIRLLVTKLKKTKNNIAVIGGSDPFLRKKGFFNNLMRLDNKFRTSPKGGYTNFIDTDNFGIKSSIFKRIGGFDENLYAGEDVDFSSKIQKMGLKLYFDPKIKVYHDKNYPLFYFVKESYQHSYDLANVWTKGHIKTGYYLKISLIIQPFIWVFFFLGILLGTWYKDALTLSLLSFLLILLLNLQEFLFFVRKKSLLFGFFSLPFLTIRSFFWFFGGVKAFLSYYLFKKIK